MTTSANETKTKVRLIKDGLTHAGKECKTGDEIEVNERQRAFLQKEGFIASDAAAKPKAADAKQ